MASACGMVVVSPLLIRPPSSDTPVARAHPMPTPDPLRSTGMVTLAVRAPRSRSQNSLAWRPSGEMTARWASVPAAGRAPAGMRRVTGPGKVPPLTPMVTRGSPAEARATGIEYSALLIHGVVDARFTIWRGSYAAPEPSGVFQGEVDENGQDAGSRVDAPGGGGLPGAAAATGPDGALAAGGRQPEASTATARAAPA